MRRRRRSQPRLRRRDEVTGLARRFSHRLAMMVGGEAGQSAVHFVLNIGLLHALPAREYGIFALVMVLGGLGLTCIRALSAMPASVWIGSSTTRRAADAYEVSFGSGACLIAVVIAFVVVLVLEAWHEPGAPLAAAFVGLWSLRSYLRIAISARFEAKPVAVGDIVFTGSGIVLSALLLALWRGNLQTGAFALLSVSNGAAIAATLWARGHPIRLSLRRSVRRRYARLGRTLGWSGIGITTTNLQGQGLALIIATMAGPAAYAPIAATFVLFVPLRIIAAALVTILQPDLSAALTNGDDQKVWHAALVWTVFLGVANVVYGGAAMLALPFLPARALEGVGGAELTTVATLAWSISLATLLYVMPRVILEAIGDLRVIAVISSVSAVVVLVSVSGLLLVATPAWAMLGGLVSEFIVLVGLWMALKWRLSGARTGPRQGWPIGGGR